MANIILEKIKTVHLREILSLIDYSGLSNSRGAMEDMAEKTHKGLPVELDPDYTGVRKRFVMTAYVIKLRFKTIFISPRITLFPTYLKI